MQKPACKGIKSEESGRGEMLGLRISRSFAKVSNASTNSELSMDNRIIEKVSIDASEKRTEPSRPLPSFLLASLRL